MELNLYMPIYLVIIVQVLLPSTSCMEHESYLMFETVQRSINQSIVKHTEQAESLFHCAYKCQRRSSESLYFNDSDQMCYCNNGSDTNAIHSPDQPTLILGGYKRSHQIVMTTDIQAPEASTTESVPQTIGVTSSTSTSTTPEYEDCGQLYEAGYTESKEYQIYIKELDRHVLVMCYMTWSTVGPTTTIQLRYDESFSFYRNWSEYLSGFGSVMGLGDYWLGLENIAAMTNARQYSLEIYMVPEVSATDLGDIWFTFDEFSLNLGENYRMTLAGLYTTNDCLSSFNATYFGDGQEFSTFDRDNDLNYTVNCAEMLESAWWFKNCGFEMNGPFSNGIPLTHCWGKAVKLSHTSMGIFKRNVNGSSI